MIETQIFLYPGEASPNDVTLRATQWVTPSTVALLLTTYMTTVTISNAQLVVPDLATMTMATFAPVITASNHQLVVPGVSTLNVTLLAPDVSATTGGGLTCIRRARLLTCGA